MAAPPLTAIDLTALVDSAPPLGSIDLTALGSPSNSATLTFSATGAGSVPYAATASAILTFSATGSAIWIDVGQGSATLEISASGTADNDFVATGSADFDLTVLGRGFQDWVSLLPPIQIQEVYRLVITGASDGLQDLAIGGISSWQATNQAGGRSAYVQAVIPAADRYLADIESRANGDLVIQKGYKLLSGEVRYEEILRARFDTLRPDRGQRALTITVSGYLGGNPFSNGTRTLTGIRSISAPNGKRRVRCDIDLFLKPGMTVTALNETFKAGYINYYVTQADKFCEVGER